MRIAICDDESVGRDVLLKAINTSNALTQSAFIDDYSDGETLLCAHMKKPFDIIFLDIEMDGMSGLETGHKIRRNDKNVIIIFVTGHKKYVFQSFQIEAFDYIMKPIDEISVNKVLTRALRKFGEQHHIIQIKSTQDSLVSLDASSIVFIQCDRRSIKIVTKDEYFYCAGELNEYEKRLVPYGFLRCHQSFLVNMNYIKSIEDSSIISVYEHTVDMSTRKRPICLKSYNAFLAKYRI